MDLDDHSPAIRFLIRDRDAKFSRSFDTVLRSEGMRVIRTPIQAPNANAHAERVIETMRAECLDWTLILGRRHLDGRSGPTPSTTTAGARIAPSASPLHEPKRGIRSPSVRTTFADEICSAGSSTSTTPPRRDRIRVSDPHGVATPAIRSAPVVSVHVPNAGESVPRRSLRTASQPDRPSTSMWIRRTRRLSWADAGPTPVGRANACSPADLVSLQRSRSPGERRL